jgi:hypothetical protein
MRILAVAPLVMICCVGCQDPSELLDTPPRNVSSPAGIASPDDVAGGAVRPATPPAVPATPAAPADPAANGNPEPQPAAEGEGNAGQGKKSIIGRSTKEVLDAREAAKDPKLEVVDPKISGNDPLSVYGSAYLRMASFAGTIGVKQWIQTEKALNDRFPTYAQLQDFLKKNPGVEFPVLPGGHMYGYDSDTGEFVIVKEKE